MNNIGRGIVIIAYDLLRFQIFLLLFILLYLASYALIQKFRRKDHEDCYSSDEDELTVYRISVWLCTFALTVTIGSLLLLPISVISNEVLLIYPDSYYVKWLNSSLIQGEIDMSILFQLLHYKKDKLVIFNLTLHSIFYIYTYLLLVTDSTILIRLFTFVYQLHQYFFTLAGLWSHVFLFSNVSLFVFLPFAYLFAESAGFFGYRPGVWSRFCETCTVLTLLAGVVLGFTFVISSFIYKNDTAAETLSKLLSAL